MLASVACTPAPDPGVPYEGSCPILIECTANINKTREAGYLAAFGELGSCWESGPNYWGGCRASCVQAIDSLNDEAIELGLETCGTCNSDSECVKGFGASSRCDAGYCARPRLGDVGDSGSTDTSGTDTGTDTTGGNNNDDESIDDICLADSTPTVVLDTSLGVMVVELDSVAAPEATELFVQHVFARFYDGSIIHRVLNQVSIQGGRFKPGPALLESPFDPVELVTPSTLEQQPGVIALVPSFDGTLLGSQWSMNAGPTLPPGETSGVVFGALIEGEAVLQAISSVPVTTVAWLDFVLHDIPEQDVVINAAYCVEQWP